MRIVRTGLPSKVTYLLTCLLVGLTIQTGFGVQEHDHRYYLREAAAAYKRKAFDEYRDNLERARSLRPSNPIILYNLAGANALLGKRSEAIELLDRVAAMGVVLAAEKDDDFASISSSDEFRRVLQRIAENRRAVSNSSVGFTLDKKGLVTEGIAYDSKTSSFFIGSIHERKIVEVDSKGRTRDFAGPSDGLWSVFGLSVDPKRRLLWACTSAMKQMKGFDPMDEGRAAVYTFDLDTRKVLHVYTIDPELPHVFGDLTIDSNGTVYVTDSLSQRIYAIGGKEARMSLYSADDQFASLQGLALDERTNSLFVADYSKGIFRIDRGTKQAHLLESPETVTLLGIDGLYFHDGSLYGIQNGIPPNRIVELALDAARTKILSLTVREANNELFDEPTLGVVVGNDLYYLANSQWDAVDENARIRSEETLKPHVVLKLPLESKR